MTQHQHMSCDDLVDYLFGELDDRAQINFERHAKNCKVCMEELRLVAPVHHELSEADTPVPSPQWFSLNRDSLLQNAFVQRPTLPDASMRSKENRVFSKRFLDRKGTWGTVIASFLVLLMIGVGYAWSGHSFTSGQTPTPVSLERKVTLSPNRTYPNAHGVALLVSQENKVNLIVYISNAPQQAPWGCYDVWGTKGGKQTSLGEFTVDTTGNGALTVSFPKVNYDSIEVTLEPGWGDSVPKGPQVFMGSLANA